MALKEHLSMFSFTLMIHFAAFNNKFMFLRRQEVEGIQKIIELICNISKNIVTDMLTAVSLENSKLYILYKHF